MMVAWENSMPSNRYTTTFLGWFDDGKRCSGFHPLHGYAYVLHVLVELTSRRPGDSASHLSDLCNLRIVSKLLIWVSKAGPATVCGPSSMTTQPQLRNILVDTGGVH